MEGKGKKPLTKAGKDWKNEAFGWTGCANAAKMKFPRPQDCPFGPEEYGAYGWGHAANGARSI